MKKLLSTLLSAVMLTASLSAPALAVIDYAAEYQNQPTATYTQVFKDVEKSHWAFSYISEMNSRGVLSGYPNGYFYPENNVTRAEFAKIMTVASSLPLDTVGGNVYKDVSSADWFYPYVYTAQYYLNGYNMNGGVYYLPNTNALREDIAMALVKLKGYDTTGYDESMLKAMFKDYLSISDYARPYVTTALEKGLISGYEDNTFRGQNSITRAEAATLLWRAYQYGSGNKVSTDMTPYVPAATPTPTPKPTPTPTLEPEYTWEIDTIIEGVDTWSEIYSDLDNNLIILHDDSIKKYNKCGELLGEWHADELVELNLWEYRTTDTVKGIFKRIIIDKNNALWVVYQGYSKEKGYIDDVYLNLYTDEYVPCRNNSDYINEDTFLKGYINGNRYTYGNQRCVGKFHYNTNEWEYTPIDRTDFPSLISYTKEGMVLITAPSTLILADYETALTEIIVKPEDINVLDQLPYEPGSSNIATSDINDVIYVKYKDNIRILKRVE